MEFDGLSVTLRFPDRSEAAQAFYSLAAFQQYSLGNMKLVSIILLFSGSILVPKSVAAYRAKTFKTSRPQCELEVEIPSGTCVGSKLEIEMIETLRKTQALLIGDLWV